MLGYNERYEPQARAAFTDMSITANQWDKAEVHACLDRMLASPLFARAERQKQLLRYLVSSTLAGRAELLKGYTIGVEVFDRAPDFDPAIDAIVRVQAGQLRAKLREYYQDQGSENPIRFELPKGAYAVHIIRQGSFFHSPLTKGKDEKRPGDLGPPRPIEDKSSLAWVKLTLFGRFEARLKSGAVVDLHSRKGELLLAYLALARGKTVTRDKLAALLWSDRSDEQARQSLRQELAAVRKGLLGSDSPLFTSEGDRIGLDPATVEIDAVTFAELVAKGTCADIERACTLYRGDLLEDVSVRDAPYEEWLLVERQRLHDLALRAFDQLLAYQQQGQASEPIAQTAQRLLKLEPADEAAHRALMRLYMDQGRRSAALRQYQECHGALKRDLNVEPGTETEQLYREILERQVESSVKSSSAIAEPLHPPSALQRSPSASAVTTPVRRHRAAIVVGALLLIAAGVAAIWQLYPHPTQPVLSPLGTDRLELPDRPSIAVLAFDNLSGDPAQDYLGDGIAEGIITSLSHLRDMLVIARNSSFSYKGKPTDVRKIGEELGVRHVLEGSVQKSGDQLRITAQLVNPETREHVWAESYDRPAADIFAVQDEIVDKIVAALDVQLVEGQQARTWRQSTTNPKAYDFFLRARELSLLFRREETYQSIELIDQALKLDPNFAMAYAWKGWNYVFLAWSESSESAAKSWEQAIANAERAIAIDPRLYSAHALLGNVYIEYKGDYEAGIRELELAAKLSPNVATTHALLALFLPYVGRSQEALEHIQKAWRLSPFPEDWYFDALGRTYHGAGRYDEAIAAWNECIRRLPDYIWCRVELTFTYMKTGREEEAREQAKEVLRINPQFSISDWAKMVFPESEVALLRKTGLPE